MDGEYRPWAVAGDRVEAVGATRYLTENRQAVEREYHNVFLLEFDDERPVQGVHRALHMPRSD